MGVLYKNKNAKIIKMDNQMRRELGRDNSPPPGRMTQIFAEETLQAYWS
jgi:hypothetical protein